MAETVSSTPRGSSIDTIHTNHAFLTGAVAPEVAVARAAELGHSALAVIDDDGLYGVIKAHLAGKQAGVRVITGSTMTLIGEDLPPPLERPADHPHRVVLLAQNVEGYTNLCELICKSRLAHPKGQAGLEWRAIAERSSGLCAFVPYPDQPARLAGLAEAFPDRFYVGVIRAFCAGDEERLHRARALAEHLKVPLLAHTDAHTAFRAQQPLQDVVTAIRHRTTLAAAGRKLFPNAERTLKSTAELLALFPEHPDAVHRADELAARCSFTLDELKYEFSQEELPPGLTPQQYLGQLVEEGLHLRYPAGIPEPVRKQILKELELIGALDFAGYFLALWDIVRFARSQGILCQGRGSAANSAVCYVLQITSIDPVRMGLLFERFLSMERREPPDIDVDFEHQRREEVIQYVYGKHGRHRAAMVSEIISYRGRSAVRDVGKALGLALDQVDRLAKALDVEEEVGPFQLRSAGLNPGDLKVRQTIALARQLASTPRHLSIHVGGFVITHGRLTSLVPLENGRMKDRTVCQWDKDDLSALNILKVDLLGLGMLTVVARTFELLLQHCGSSPTMATVPAEDPEVYEMLCQADAIGVFQIESRAQMNMLPRLKPRCFYDLVVEIAIIRPGPIVGDMVHPYLRRRDGIEPVTYPSPQVEEILKRTLGVPLFQEQAMKLAMVAGGFSPGEADGLRRALSNKRAEQLLPKYRDRFIEGAVSRGYERSFAERCFKQFDGFAHYGFPESHSASFALIAYVTAWQKRYHPAAFCAALLDAQPMGFYAVHTLVDDARRHGVEVRAIDVNASNWKCSLERGEREAQQSDPCRSPPAESRGDPAGWGKAGPALRLGMELVRGLREESAKRVMEARTRGPFTAVGQLARRARIPRYELTRLALAGALGSLCASRREALWEIHALGPLEEDDLFFGLPMDSQTVPLPSMGPRERVATDYETIGLSLEQHPIGLLRPQLNKLGAITAAQLQDSRAGQWVKVGGLVIVRQRPPTAKGFTFLSIEDETGIANFVVTPQHFDTYRREITGTALVLGEGRLEREGRVVNLKIERMQRLDAQLD
jgi:error-prone DNA polymerase